MKIAAFTRYGRRAASTRQRFLQYFPALRAAGIEVEHYPLFDDDYVAALVAGRAYPPAKVAGAYARRIKQVRASRACDLLWVYGEMLPYLPATAERLLTGSRPIVYDFDDAFFHAYDQSDNSLVRTVLRDKHASLLRRAVACTCGNAYVREFVARYCANSIILPTVVDTDVYEPVAQADGGPLTIGWIGSPSTWCGVQPILSLLADICTRHQARFLIVGAGQAAAKDQFPGMEQREWSEAREVEDIQSMDVGIMPLLDRPFERGKSGYKLVQYMACGLPVVASPIGVNAEIVKDGVNGFLAATEEQWRQALSSLLQDAQLRNRLGKAGREQAVGQFSLDSQKDRLIDLFESVVV